MFSFYFSLFIDGGAQCRPSAPGYISAQLIYYLVLVKVNSNQPRPCLMLRLGPVKLMLCSNSRSKVELSSNLFIYSCQAHRRSTYKKTLPPFCRNGSVHFSCVSLFMNTLAQKKKGRNAAGGREEETKFARYQQNYPQYKIIICNFFFLVRTRLSTVPRGLSDTAKQPRTENERDMIPQKAIYTKTQDKPVNSFKLRVSLLFFFFLEHISCYIHQRKQESNRMLNLLVNEKQCNVIPRL